MISIALKITFKIFDSISLKDKRSVVKSIIHRMKRKYNISIAEIEDHDIINQGVVGIGIVGNNGRLCRQILEQVIADIEEQYQVEIYDIEEI